MTWTLWDALKPETKARARRGRAAMERPQPEEQARAAPQRDGDTARVNPSPGAGARGGDAGPAGVLGGPSGARRARHRPSASPRRMQDRYEAMTREMLGRYGVRVRRWRSSMSGVAWQLRYADGSISRLIESPRPCGPMSAAVFLHEIGHHAIGFGVYSPRCLEEFHAWGFALREMERLGVTITEGVRRRVAESLWYAVDKARRRGLRVIPAELAPYVERPPRRSRRGAARAGARR